MKDGGIHFVKTELLELSLVTIPANTEASINSLKAFDVASKDAELTTVHPRATAEGATQPGATKPAARAAQRKQTTMTKPMTILEQISAFEAKRAATVARNEELMQKAADAGQTLDDAESQEYDDGAAEIARVDAHLKRLHTLEENNRAK